MNKDLQLIYNFQKEEKILGHIARILEWDNQVYMPKKAIHSRAEQLAEIYQLIHKKTISNELFNSLKKLRKKKLSKKDSLIVKKLYKDVLRARKLPESFIRELTKTTTIAHQSWKEARKKNNFKIFQPGLEKIIKLKQKEAQYIKEPGHIYNSLFDQYEEGMTVEKLKPIFAKLKKQLIILLKNIKSSQVYKNQKKTLLKKNFPEEKQRKLCEEVIKKIGLQEESSRLDLSTHPFTEKLGVDDVRITTNFRKDPLFSFTSTIHEAGHALYELQLPKQESYTILGEAPSLGIHESQSRFWENNIGKSRSFWKYYYKKFNKEYNFKGSLQQWYKEVNMVHPSFIRVEADEVTYCLHAILRFEIEIGLIEGSIKVKDLPKIWNKKMKESLGITPKTNTEGVLQDVHWSGGYLGYFPTYAIGSIYSAQLYAQLKREKPGIDKQIEKGNFSQIITWLKNKVHSHGSKLMAEEIIKKATKQGLNPDIYVNYLNNKFSKIYKF